MNQLRSTNIRIVFFLRIKRYVSISLSVPKLMYCDTANSTWIYIFVTFAFSCILDIELIFSHSIIISSSNRPFHYLKISFLSIFANLKRAQLCYRILFAIFLCKIYVDSGYEIFFNALAFLDIFLSIIYLSCILYACPMKPFQFRHIILFSFIYQWHYQLLFPSCAWITLPQLVLFLSCIPLIDVKG